jgi:hypothetical protein
VFYTKADSREHDFDYCSLPTNNRQWICILIRTTGGFKDFSAGGDTGLINNRMGALNHLQIGICQIQQPTPTVLRKYLDDSTLNCSCMTHHNNLGFID